MDTRVWRSGDRRQRSSQESLLTGTILYTSSSSASLWSIFTRMWKQRDRELEQQLVRASISSGKPKLRGKSGGKDQYSVRGKVRQNVV